MPAARHRSPASRGSRRRAEPRGRPGACAATARRRSASRGPARQKKTSSCPRGCSALVNARGHAHPLPDCHCRAAALGDGGREGRCVRCPPTLVWLGSMRPFNRHRRMPCRSEADLPPDETAVLGQHQLAGEALAGGAVVTTPSLAVVNPRSAQPRFPVCPPGSEAISRKTTPEGQTTVIDTSTAEGSCPSLIFPIPPEVMTTGCPVPMKTSPRTSRCVCPNDLPSGPRYR